MRELYTARLEKKVLLSAAAQCYHFEFRLVDTLALAFEPGQFLSLVAEDPLGKTYTRAYSIASGPTTPGEAAHTASFDLCVNRVQGGFFSNLLCDMNEGETIRCHGPHGLFTLKQQPAKSLFIAAGTGIAPIRGFLQTIVRSVGLGAWAGCLIYEAADPGEFFYGNYFQELAAAHPGFHYMPVLGGEGRHEQVEAAIVQVAEGSALDSASTAAGEGSQEFIRYAYVCGLNEIVKVARARLASCGWQKRQVLFERYD